MKNKKKLILLIIITVALVVISTTVGVYVHNSFSDSLTVYETLKKDGYQGTVSQWLISLIEETVLDNQSAYEEAVENGYSGSYEDWICLYFEEIDLNKCVTNEEKENPKTSYDYALENGFNGTEKQWIACFGDKNSKKSSYELCVEMDFSGDRIDWIKAINIQNDDLLYRSSKDAGYKGSEIQWIAMLLSNSNDYCNKIEATYFIVNSCGYNKSLSKWISSLSEELTIEDRSVLFYSYAVEKGYSNSYVEWLKTIVQSTDNENSIYDQIVINGYTGSKEDLLYAIRNSKNIDEFHNNLVENGYTGTKNELEKIISNNNNDNLLNDDDILQKGGFDQEKINNIPTIIVKNSTVNLREKTVDVVIFVKNNPGILGMKLTLEYDSSAMTLKSAKNGEAVSDILTLTKPKSLSTGCSFGWDGVRISSDEIKDGPIIILSFDFTDTVKRGSYPITVHYKKGNIVDNNLRPINFEIVNGEVNVVK